MERPSIIITMSREEIEQSMEATYWREFGMRWVEARAYLVHVKPMYR